MLTLVPARTQTHRLTKSIDNTNQSRKINSTKVNKKNCGRQSRGLELIANEYSREAVERTTEKKKLIIMREPLDRESVRTPRPSSTLRYVNNSSIEQLHALFHSTILHTRRERLQINLGTNDELYLWWAQIKNVVCTF